MKVVNKLYGKEIELIFENFGHKYTVDGDRIPSVTGVLNIVAKPALIPWAARMAVEHISGSIDPGVSYDEVQLQTIFKGAKNAHYAKKVDAGNLGTFIHNWIEKYINGEDPGIPVNEDLKRSIDSFLEWVKKHDVKFLVSEQVVYSRKYKYTGTLDFICMFDKKMYIGDIKTSSGIYPEQLIQTCAYRYAREEEYPSEKYAGQLILRIDKKDGSIEMAFLREKALYKEMLRSFLHAMELQKTMNKLKSYKPGKE